MRCSLRMLQKITANITVDSVSIILKKKQNGNKNDEKEDHLVIYYDKDEVNKSEDENMSEQKQTVSKKTTSKLIYLNTSYLDNILPTTSLSTMLGKCTAQKSTMDQSTKSNRTRIDHVSFLDITKVSEELAISRACSDEMIIHTNQVSSSIDRWFHVDQKLSFKSWKSCDEMSIDFGQDTNISIPMNPTRTTGSITPQAPSLESVTGI